MSFRGNINSKKGGSEIIRVSCENCGGADFSYTEKLLLFRCKKCRASFRDPQWSKELQDKSAIDATIGRKGKKPIVLNTGAGNISVTFSNQSKPIIVFLSIIASLITIGRFVIPYIVSLLYAEDGIELFSIATIKPDFLNTIWLFAIFIVVLIAFIYFLLKKSSRNTSKHSTETRNVYDKQNKVVEQHRFHKKQTLKRPCDNLK